LYDDKYRSQTKIVFLEFSTSANNFKIFFCVIFKLCRVIIAPNWKKNLIFFDFLKILLGLQYNQWYLWLATGISL